LKKLLFALLFALFLPAPASATWSIIAIDMRTGRVVISSATCAAQGPNQLKLLQAIVIPGIGVAAAQAGVDRTQANHRLIVEELRKRTHPEQIIRMLEADPAVERRQFGIIDMLGRSAGRSGSGNRDVALDIQGMSPDSILYSVQGNIIATTEALTEAARIMQEDASPVIDRVMLAMEQADALGGDARCTCDTEPLPGAQCTGKTAHVAYILAADVKDPMGTFHVDHPEDLRAPYNNGDYHLYLAVWPANTEPHEDANPVRTLRMRYDAWKAGEARRASGP
jgi:hypothetical protein